MPRSPALVCLIGLAAAPPGSAEAQTVTTYTYDAQGRLLQAAHQDGVNNDVAVTAGFDSADNRRQLTVSGRSKRRVIVLALDGFTVIPLP